MATVMVGTLSYHLFMMVVKFLMTVDIVQSINSFEEDRHRYRAMQQQSCQTAPTVPTAWPVSLAPSSLNTAAVVLALLTVVVNFLFL